MDKFPIEYEPINYNFFGVNIAVAGVGYNLAKSLSTLGDDVDLAAIVGNDMASKLVFSELNDIAAVCNANYSRPLLSKAKGAGVKIATDVHVLGDTDDEYNKEFMEYADILFLSNEYIIGRERSFVEKLAEKYNNEIIVVGQGSAGALMYVRDEEKFYDMPAARTEKIVNTVGAGDCLFSTFISMYAKGELTPVMCLELAQKAAAHKIGFDGAAKGFMRLDELVS